MKVAAEAVYCEYLLNINRGPRVANEYKIRGFSEPVSAMRERGRESREK